MNMVNYSDLKPTLKTGDLLLFQGTDVLDWMIQLEGNSPYNHVGMVVISTTNQWCFWDAPGGGNQFPDPLTGKLSHAGARSADLDTLVKYYMSGNGTRMYCRQITPAPTAQEMNALLIFVGLADGAPFPGADLKFPDDFNLGAGVVLSYALGDKFNLTISGTFFCAQLIAQTYMSMGWIGILGKPANAYSPALFGGAPGTNLTLLGGHALSDVVEVNYNAAAAAGP